MIDVSAAHDCNRLEAAMRMLRKSGHDVAVVHAPAVAAFEILPDVVPRERRSRPEPLIPFGVIVDVMNAKKKRVVGLPARLKGRDVYNRIVHSLRVSSLSSQAAAFRALILFDIDGTLVRRAGPHHREALVEGVRRVTGLETTTEGIPVQGMLDPDIVTMMLTRAGASRATIRRALPEIQRVAERYYLRVCPEIHDKCCPSVLDVLERLARRNILLGLVTGNLTRIGWHKLKRAGLHHHFRFGAFGEMAATRAGLARMAIRQARDQAWIGREAPISLIGDSPNDVIAARENRIRSIAVRTGITPPAELEAERPDFLLRTLRDLRVRMVEE